jgi:hypothetical protein
VSPIIWEVQKSSHWTQEKVGKQLKGLSKLKHCKDYVGILSAEPELKSLRDRLVIIPVNYPKEIYKEPFLVERCRKVMVYDWSGEVAFTGEMIPEQRTDFLKWCSGYFIRLVGVQPPVFGP